jgi:hypothetical protein
METWEKAIDLEQYIHDYTPKEYREPIYYFDFVPTITDQNYLDFEAAYQSDKLIDYLTEYLTSYSDFTFKSIPFKRFNKPYIIEAIKDYFDVTTFNAKYEKIENERCNKK